MGESAVRWALLNFFCLLDGRLFEVGANSRCSKPLTMRVFQLSWDKGAPTKSGVSKTLVRVGVYLFLKE